MNYQFTPPPITSAAIHGEDTQFPVRRIYCVGRNYAGHIREMGFDPSREPAFFFQKPTDSIVANNQTIAYSQDTDDLHYEIELVLAIGKQGSNVSYDDALDYIYAYGVGIDLTRRDRQLEARERGRPWEPGKSFDQSAPLAELHPATKVGHLSKGRIWLAVNDEIKQDSDINHLIWSVPEIITELSKTVTLMPGDIIYSGTPEGIGPVVAGDVITGGIDGLSDIKLTIGEKE